MSAPLPLSHRRRGRRGFTLVELMLSLVMGLIVAMAAVALAKTATTTFHEQARSSVTEMAVRTAAERLRQDLMRVSYMSTGNIQLDPKIAHRPTATGTAQARWPTELGTLRGVRINVADGVTPISTANQLSPDSIEIAGNLTTDDQYTGTIITGGCGQIVRLDPLADAAVWTLAAGDPNDATGKFTANATNAFQPTPGDQYLAQVVDAVGCRHYAPVCSVQLTPNATGTARYLEIGLSALGQTDTGSPLRAVLYANNSDGSALANNCGSSEMGQVTISPVSRIKWSLVPTPKAALAPDATLDANKYDIVRQRLNWAGQPSSVPPEIVAEYGVDLKFGITYLNPMAAVNTERIVTADLEGTTSATTITNVTGGNPSAGNPGPQHVRSVRYRVAVRTSLPDRDSNLVVAPAPYLTRYCAAGGSIASCKRWSRVRTIVSEVSLSNQAAMTW